MNFLKKLINLGPLDGWKTILGTALMLLAQFVPGFPVLDLSHGITGAEMLLVLAALKKLLEKFKK